MHNVNTYFYGLLPLCLGLCDRQFFASRMDTWDEDLKKLREIMEKARSPSLGPNRHSDGANKRATKKRNDI